MNASVYIGIDAGASKTELLAASSQDAELLNLFGSSANPSRVGFDRSIDVLASLVEEAVERLAGRRVESVFAGVAGAGRTDDQERIHAGLAARLTTLTADRITVAHDAEIALEAAFKGKSGIMVIAGTGSVALARDEGGELRRVGGWGYLVGDEGSGYAIGASGLRVALHAFDGGPETILVELLARDRNVRSPDDVMLVVYEEKQPLQKFAPLVIRAAESGDAVARRILEEQARGLAFQVKWLADRCSGVLPHVALLGGLTNESFYRALLQEAILEQLPGWTFPRPMNRPVVGAWRLARALVGVPPG